MLDEFIKDTIKTEVSAAFGAFGKSFDLLPGLPPIATTAETAKALRVSDEVVRRMSEDGMPHSHAGRELRFGKSLIVEWMTSGKIYPCEVCEKKANKNNPAAEREQQPETDSNVLNIKTSRKLAEFAGGSVK